MDAHENRSNAFPPARRAACTLAAAVALVATSGASAQQPDETAERARARALFEQGVAAFEAEDYPSARDAFLASLDIRENATVLFNLANTQQALFDYPVAVASFRRYIEMQGDGLPQDERAEIAARIDEMESKMARVTVVALDGATIAIDGRNVGTTPLPGPVWVMPEDHVLTATLSGYEPAREEIGPLRGENLAVRLEMQPIAVAVVEPPPVEPPPVEPLPVEPLPVEPPPVEPPPVEPPPSTDVAIEAEGPDDSYWGLVPLEASVGANWLAVDFDNRGFADNFFWAVGAGVQFNGWAGLALDVIVPSVDIALWGRFAFVRTGWFRLAGAPGFVLATGASDKRGGGVAGAVGLLGEFRVFSGLAFSLFPAFALDNRGNVTLPMTIGASFYL